MEIPRPVAEIPDGARAAFERAMAKQGVDLKLYKVSYFTQDNHFIVVTSYSEKPPRFRGSVPGFPDYEVSISKIDYSILKVVLSR
jgi:hypothetical protein